MSTHYLDADHVVVGSGAGGAVAAFELARRGCDVVLVEEGQRAGAALAEASISERMLRFYKIGRAHV